MTSCNCLKMTSHCRQHGKQDFIITNVIMGTESCQVTISCPTCRCEKIITTTPEAWTDFFTKPGKLKILPPVKKD